MTISAFEITTLREGLKIESHVVPTNSSLESLTFHVTTGEQEVLVEPHLEHGITRIRVKAYESPAPVVRGRVRGLTVRQAATVENMIQEALMEHEEEIHD